MESSHDSHWFRVTGLQKGVMKDFTNTGQKASLVQVWRLVLTSLLQLHLLATDALRGRDIVKEDYKIDYAANREHVWYCILEQ